MQFILQPNFLRAGIVLVVTALLGFGYFLQYAEGLEPCPLCITQRFFLFSCAVVALIALIHRPASVGIKVYAWLGAIVALIGSGFSSRQLYLQSLPPDQAPACGPSIDFIFDTFPLTEALSILLRGNGNCAQVSWTFLSLSIPGWTLLAFLALAAAALLQLKKPVSKQPKIDLSA